MMETTEPPTGQTPASGQPGQQQPIVIVIQGDSGSKSDKEHFQKTFPQKAMRILSWLQIVMGAIVCLAQVCFLLQT